MKTIETKSAPAAIGPYSQAILANGFLYTSGQIPLNPETGAIEGSTIEAQTEQAIKNLGEILKAAGTDFSKVVKTNADIDYKCMIAGGLLCLLRFHPG